MIIWVDSENAFNKIQYSFMILKKTYQNGFRGNISQIIKASYNKPMATIILNIEELKVFLLKY